MGSLVRVLPALVAAISCFTALAIDIPDLRYLKAYINDDPDGPYHEFLDYSPDLSVQGMDNSIRRVCLTGQWLLHGEHYYSGYEAFYRSVNGCYNLSSSASISSLRYAGSPYGLDDVYYNLYEGINWGGNEFKGNTNAPTVANLDMNVSSLSISGQSPWTFFTGLQYAGEAVCVYPYLLTNNGVDLHYREIAYVRKQKEPSIFYSPKITSLGIPDNSIRSVAKGCLTDNVYRGDRPHQGERGDPDGH
ncbi:uncharacterized protein LOC108670089 [Hyalella azteca]|uniref:Uncharacterized protein LOC108670089 n=1 Tax=Hyalella azteca TaxID=294128 RepID=A0A8B7NHC4_HYAAZ|nr:uncharacterized protein LOC108670089 [Hyalella azteca]